MRFLRFAVMFCFLAGVVPVYAHGPESSVPQTTTSYALIMSNGSKIPVSEYSIDLKNETITYRSRSTDFVATFPLERIKKVVTYTASDTETVPDTAVAVYINNTSVSDSPDDGGVPVTFKVKHVSVGSRGRSYVGRTSTGTKRYTSTGSSRHTTSSSRSSYGRSGSRTTPSRSSRSSSSSYHSRSSRSYSNTSSRSSSSSRSYGGSSNSNTEDFFTALFGGRR